MNPDGSDVVDISPGPGCCYGQPSLTPDGRHVVYEHCDPASNEDADEIMNVDGSRPRTNIAAIRPDGRGLRYLTHDQGGQNADNAFAGSYSPSGRWIVFRQEDHGRYALERMRPDGTGARIIVPFSTTLLPRSSDWGPEPVAGAADRRAVTSRPHAALIGGVGNPGAG